MRVLYLADRMPWFGAHTGYERLPDYLPATGIESRVYTPRSGVAARVTGKAVSLLRGHGRISQSHAAARARLELGLRWRRDAVGHLLYGEEHLPFWRDAAPAARRRSVLTLHQPPAQLDEVKAASLSACPHAIVLWRRDLDWFRERLKGGTVDFIPHGVDLDFFSPAPEAKERSGPRRLLYAGVHLRNPAMLARLVARLSRERDDVHFDLLVPEHRRGEAGLAELARHPLVTWHAGLSDEQLRDLYRAAYLLLLPMRDSGANTAVVEALACGLPIVTTDVGGIRDYGGGTLFPVVGNNDDEGMLGVIDAYLADPARRDEAARRGRAFAEAHLAWPEVARRHAEVYRKVLG